MAAVALAVNPGDNSNEEKENLSRWDAFTPTGGRSSPTNMRKRPWEESESEDESDDDEAGEALALALFVASAKRADVWSHACRPPTPAEAVDADDAVWSAKSRGYVIAPAGGKGLGAFAGALAVAEGALVGVYAGELLTEAEHARRESSYCFSLLPPADELTSKALAGLGLDGKDKDDEYIAYIDGENAARSSWCRYINHAPHGARACNLEVKVDAMKALVWFEASRDIAPGEELCFGTRPALSHCPRHRL